MKRMATLLIMASALMAGGHAFVSAQTRNPSAAAPAGVALREVAAARTNDVASMAISPDGRKLVFSGMSEGRMKLWVKLLDSDMARSLPGTEDAVFPFWSPDSQSIGFFGNNALQRMDVDSGSIRTLQANVNWGAGGTWNQDGTILFASHGRYMIFKIPAAGGPSQPVTIRGPQEFSHVHPQFLPDGRHFLYYVTGPPATLGIYVGQIVTPSVIGTFFNELLGFGSPGGGIRLVDSEAAGVYASGRLLFLRQGTLLAQEFDPVKLTLSGSPATLAERVPIGGRSVAALSSAAGHVIYRTGPEGSARQLTWFDRSGKKLETVGQPLLTGAGAPSLSPDGNSVVVNRLVDGVGDIWTGDLRTGSFTPFASDVFNESYPAWSSDGLRIAFSSNKRGTYEMFEKPVGRAAGETPVFSTPILRHAMDWSRDGRYLIYRTGSPDLWALQREGMVEIPIIQAGPFEVRWPQFSPNGKWIAFQSNATGRNEIHIHGPFEPPSLGQTSKPLSTRGGAWVRWRADGNELFYAAFDGTLMAVPMTFNSNGRDFTAGTPVALFTPPMAGGPDNNSVAQQYMVSRDGQRFLVVAAPQVESPIKLLRNWKP